MTKAEIIEYLYENNVRGDITIEQMAEDLAEQTEPQKCDDCVWSVCNYNKVDWERAEQTEPTISKMEQVEMMSCQECKHFHENAVMYLDQCDFCFKDCKYEPKDEPQTDVYDYKGNGKWERSE